MTKKYHRQKQSNYIKFYHSKKALNLGLALIYCFSHQLSMLYITFQPQKTL